MDWDKLRVFHAVAKAGSLTLASETLHLSQSAISRQISALEHTLSSTLFHRHPRGLILTGEGEALFDATKAMSDELSLAEARLRDAREGVNGELRITTTHGFGALWLSPRLKGLYEQYPNLRLELLLTEDILDISMRQADVAIRMRPPTQTDLISRKLLSPTIRLYASKSYLAYRKAPETPEDLKEHRLLAYSTTAWQPISDLNWLFARYPALRPVYTVNSHQGLITSACEGVGIAPLPDFLAIDNDQLMLVAPQIKGPTFEVHLAYPQELRKSKRVAVFKEYILTQIGNVS